MKRQLSRSGISKILLHVVLWVVIVYLVNELATLKYEDVYFTKGQKLLVHTEKSILPVVIAVLVSKAVFIYLAALALLPYFMHRNQLITGLFFCLLLLVVIIAGEIGAHFLIQQQTDISYKELKQFPFIDVVLYLLAIGIVLTYFFVRQWLFSQKKINDMQHNQLLTELDFLKSQINPHFLFNTLNNLFSLAQRDGKENIANAVSKLSHLMRYMLHESNAAKVELSKEIDYITNYIDLAKMRYTDADVEVAFEKKGDISSTLIEPMLLIPFVENAFKHGVAIGNRSRLNFILEVTDHAIIFSGTNPDHSKINNRPKDPHGIGLLNVGKRIDLLYNKEGHLSYGTKDNLFMFSLQIPLTL